MKHIHIALVLFVCSFVTLSCAKSTLVYRRYHRKRPSLRKVQKNVVEIVEVFKTNRKPPALMKSDKSIEKFLLCDAKCEKKRFLKRRKICLRTGRFCPTRPSGTKKQSTTQINVSTRPIYQKPTVYQQNPYGNQNPDYTHLYPWSRPSVTVTKYQPDGSKDFNMTIVEVNNDTVITTIKDDYEYYDVDNDDRYQQRRSTTFRVPTTTQERIKPEIVTSLPLEVSLNGSSTTEPSTVIQTTTNLIVASPDTLIEIGTLTEPPKLTAIYTESSLIKATTEPVRPTLATTTEAPLLFTEVPIVIPYLPEPVTESSTAYFLPAPPTPAIIFDPITTSSTTAIPTTETSTTEYVTTETTSSTSTTTEPPPTTSTSTTTESPTTPTSTTTESPTTPTSTTTESPTTQTSTTTVTPTTPTTSELPSTTTFTLGILSTSTSSIDDVNSVRIPTTTEISTKENQTELANTELEAEGEEYVEEYDEGEGEEGAEDGAEEGAEEEENGQVDADGANGNDGVYDYDDDGNYGDEE